MSSQVLHHVSRLESQRLIESNNSQKYLTGIVLVAEENSSSTSTSPGQLSHFQKKKSKIEQAAIAPRKVPYCSPM